MLVGRWLAQHMQQLVLDRVNPLLGALDELEIHGGTCCEGCPGSPHRASEDPKERCTFKHKVNEQGAA